MGKSICTILAFLIITSHAHAWESASEWRLKRKVCQMKGMVYEGEPGFMQPTWTDKDGCRHKKQKQKRKVNRHEKV